MNYALNSTIALTAAPPGWQVHISPGGPRHCPVVGWASVVTDFDPDGAPRTEVQPVFVHDDGVMTAAEYRATYDEYATVAVMPS